MFSIFSYVNLKDFLPIPTIFFFVFYFVVKLRCLKFVKLLNFEIFGRISYKFTFEHMWTHRPVRVCISPCNKK